MSETANKETAINGEIFVQKTPKGDIMINFEETEPFKFLIRGPKEIISKAIGGIGDENETEAWATEKDLKTEAQRMFAVLEVSRIVSKMRSEAKK